MKIKEIIRKIYDKTGHGYTATAISVLKKSGLMGDKTHQKIKNIVENEIQRYEKEYFEKYKSYISEYRYESPTMILSIMYIDGFKGKYTDSYKKIQKEIQRIDTSELKSYKSLIKKAKSTDHLLSKISHYKRALSFRGDKKIEEKLKDLEEDFHSDQIIEDEKQFSENTIQLKDSSIIKIYLDPNNRNTLMMEQEQEGKKGFRLVNHFAAIPPLKETTDIFWIGERTSKATGYKHNSEALIIMRDENDTIRIYYKGSLLIENYCEEELKKIINKIK